MRLCIDGYWPPYQPGLTGWLPYAECRFRWLPVSRELWTDMLTTGAPHLTDAPSDLRLVGVSDMGCDRDCFTMVVASAEFDVVLFGAEIPELVVVFTARTVAAPDGQTPAET